MAAGIFFAPALLFKPAAGLSPDTKDIRAGKTIVDNTTSEPADGTPVGGLEAAPAPALKVNAAHGAASAPARARQMERSAEITLIVPDIDRALGAVGSLARAAGGDVTKLDDERPENPRDRRTADVSLIVPQDRFASSLARIAQFGGVRSRTVSAQDVGDQLVDDHARLRNLRRTEADMLNIMDRSGKIGEVLDVENQLASVREQIEKLDAQTQALEGRVVMSTIDVSLETEAQSSSAEPSVASRLADAWVAAWHSSREAAVGLLARTFVLIAFAPYWLALLGLGGLVALLLRRYRQRAHAAG